MPDRRTPLEETDRLVIDGTNLLHAIGRTAAVPPAAVIGRLRAAVPPSIAIELVFDGGGPGPKGRVATAMTVRYAGRRPGDEVVLEQAELAVRALGDTPASSARVLVVTDDRALRDLLSARGIRTAGTRWLIGRLDQPTLASPAAGNRRAPRSGVPGSGQGGLGPGRGPGIGSVGGPGGPGDLAVPGSKSEDQEVPPRRWRPGRRATAKIGPPRKVARHRRKPRH
jgi:hypothetical protein